MKKPYIWGVLVLAILVSALLIIKANWKDNPDKANSDLGGEAKAESFAPASMPTISAEEKVMGSIKAQVKIVVYEDYSSTFSADVAETLKRLQDEFGNKIVVAVRPFAIKEKPASIEAAMAVECASDQGKWKEMRDSVFKAVKDNNLSTIEIKAFSGQIGLDQDKFNACLTSLEKQGIMLQVASSAKQFSVYGSPTIFVNDELVIGARPYEDYQDESGAKVEGLKSLVERQLNKGN